MVKWLLLVQLVLICTPSAMLADKIVTVLIISNSLETPFQQAIIGYKEELSLVQNVRFNEVSLAKEKNAEVTLSKMINEMRPDLIYSLGGESTEIALKSTASIPIVATMILKKFSYKGVNNITGVYLNYPLSIQFQWLKKFFPEQRKIAIFFNPEENGETVLEARKLAARDRLELISIPVDTPKELPYALDQLRNNVEILLAIPDAIAMSSKTAKEVLLASFRNRVPLIGLSDNWVKSGALYSLSWDFNDLGRQCANQSDKLIKGTSILKVPIEYPRKTTYSINAKIAEHMNMEISQALLKNAKFIFN